MLYSQENERLKNEQRNQRNRLMEKNNKIENEALRDNYKQKYDMQYERILSQNKMDGQNNYIKNENKQEEILTKIQNDNKINSMILDNKHQETLEKLDLEKNKIEKEKEIK